MMMMIIIIIKFEGIVWADHEEYVAEMTHVQGVPGEM
jgi:hypothetical protein